SDFAKAKKGALDKEIRSTGFYKNKAKNIIAASKMIQKKYGGKVPDAMEELTALPGVARKTANIVLFHLFNKNEGIAVDTHVKRVSARLGMTGNKDPEKIEKDLMELFDRKKWGHLSNILIFHGRAICDARKPLCPDCPVKKLCLSTKEFYPDL
ncbi:MAG: endonuclease III, partial [Candidatus Omnitrophota bacterium]